MEQTLYMIGVIISGIITGLSVYAVKGGDTVEQRKEKLKNRHSKTSTQTNEIVAASLATTQMAMSTQSSMWSKIEALEKEQGIQACKLNEQAKEMAELRKQNAQKDKQIQEQQQEINQLKRKVELLREKLKAQGIEITDKELEELL